MKALAVTEIGKKAELIEMEVPRADADSVVIKTVYSGVSIGTEMWIAEGKRSDYGEPPFVNGYQASGRIVEVGENGRALFQVGDLVTVFCSGAHAEYVKAHWALVHKVSKEESLKVCSMFVQPSVAANAWNMAGVNMGDLVYIAGQGLIGQCAAMIARLRGAYVVASDISQDRIERSRAYCADWTIDASEQPALAAFLERFPKGADIAAESTGFEALLDDAMSACRTKGTFVFMGWYPGRASFAFNTPHNKQLNALFPCFIGERPVREGVIRLMESGTLNILPLITHEVGWEESEAIYNTLFTKRRNDYNGIVIRWE
ncbi:zinc-binding dehydrogenase [Paenibacillus sp.]|uniref:zinc-dependent alcohol dehydrogenase n=1 Tax=Paenibacillus sp. TaxID=58172 RepID=UPI002D34459A|nr:zinc-binding dehydrogenase [Paenibacillus sp.]HZG55612.1 zinc-binding dehydrogenase [Paenibacillus sp.]